MDQFMGETLRQARLVAEEGSIPIGTELVDGQGWLVATGRSRRVQDQAVVLQGENQLPLQRGQDPEPPAKFLRAIDIVPMEEEVPGDGGGRGASAAGPGKGAISQLRSTLASSVPSGHGR